MIGGFAAEGPSVGIFWMVATGPGEVRLLTAGCSLEAAEPYGDYLTFPDRHYEVWDQWRTVKESDPLLQAVVTTFEYEDWPRDRIVFDELEDRFVLYADRKLMRPRTIAQIQKRFSILAEQTTVETDFHYQSDKRPGPLP